MQLDAFIKEIDFIKYTPDSLVTLIADGELGIIYILPSLLSLVVYAWFCFWLVDKAISLFSNFALKWVISPHRVWRMRIGTLSTRAQFFFSTFLGYLLKAFFGLPMFYISNLLLSKDEADFDKFSELITGYSWQDDALQKVFASSITEFYLPTTMENIVQLVIISGFLIYTYVYAYRGFDLVRRIREVGDALVMRAKIRGISKPTHLEAIVNIVKPFSSSEEKSALTWFLMMYNMRITIKNINYVSRTPDQYGRFKVITTFLVAASLTFLHPIISGLYLASTSKALLKLNSARKVYESKFAALPNEIKTMVNKKYIQKY